MKQADSFLSEVSRILKSKGIFLSISFAQPHFRTKYLMNAVDQFEVTPYKSLKGYCEKFKWNLTFESIGGFEGSLDTFFYVMKLQK
jgi:ubiquinone/menaquinone biosynthesis C-methylase UbiE